MKTARLFKNGQSQAVRLPKEFRMPGSSVYIQHLGDYVVLIPKDDPWRSMIEATQGFSEDFMGDREQPTAQAREDFD